MTGDMSNYNTSNDHSSSSSPPPTTITTTPIPTTTTNTTTTEDNYETNQEKEMHPSEEEETRTRPESQRITEPRNVVCMYVCMICMDCHSFFSVSHSFVLF
jgi:hypothetical protein